MWSGCRNGGGSVEYVSFTHTGTSCQAHCTHNPAPAHLRSTIPLVEGLPSLAPRLTRESRLKRGEADNTLRNNSAKPRLCVCVCAPSYVPSFQGFGGEATLLGAKSGCHDNHYRCTPPISFTTPTTAILASSGGDSHQRRGVSPRDTTISPMGVSPSSSQATSLSFACHLRKPLDQAEGQGTRQSL